MTSKTFFAFEVQQDTLVRPSTRQNRSFLNIPVEKPKIDLERAQEVIEQSEQREQQIIKAQRRVYTPKVELLREPSIEVDSLMAKYQHIGCAPRASFPDTFLLTVLERYYQPIESKMVPQPVSADTTQLVASAGTKDTTRIVSTAGATDTMPIVPFTDSSILAKQTIITKPPVPATGFASEPRFGGYPSSITIFLLCALALLAGIKYNFGRNLLQALQSFFSYRQAQRMFEERRDSDRQAALLSNILFVLITGIFISIALPLFGIGPLWGSYLLSVLFFSLSIGLLYILKAGIWRLLGVVFMTQLFSKIYVYNMFLYNRNTGLFIFPLVAVIPYVAGEIVPYLTYSVIIIFTLSYLLKIWRIFQIIHAQSVSVYYFILYLCTLEILPLLLFIKSCKVLNDHLVM